MEASLKREITRPLAGQLEGWKTKKKGRRGGFKQQKHGG